MHCERARDLVMQRLMSEIDEAADRVLTRHLSTCAECRTYAMRMTDTDRRLQAAGVPHPLPSVREAVQGRLPAARRQRAALRFSRGLTGVAAAACILLAAAGIWEALGYGLLTAGRPSGPAVELSASFFEQRRPGTGWIATAALPTPSGTATAYYWVEPASGDRLNASILLRHPDGRLTREVQLGEVSHGRLPFTQPEFRLLEIDGQTLLAIATDAETTGRLQVFAYNPSRKRLVQVPFGSDSSVSISTWPVGIADGIRTRVGGETADWELTRRWSFVRVSRPSQSRPEIAGSALAEAQLTTPDGPVTVRLHGTVSEGASLYLYWPDGSVTHEVELGRPNFHRIALTAPKLHKLQLGSTEVLALLADPMTGKPGQAVLRIFAYDPARRQLRLVPFATGEVLVDQVPAADGNLLVTVQAGGAHRWQMSDRWLLEPAAK